MTKYLAGVLTVIAAGVLLIAYGLLVPRGASVIAPGTGLAASAGLAPGPVGRPMLAGEQMMASDSPYAFVSTADGRRIAAAYPVAADGYRLNASPYAGMQSWAVMNEADAVQAALVAPAPRRPVVRTTVQKPRRNWTKTAAVIGGSSAAAAGLGAIFGGKKGALIGAAVGGGAGTIYEAARNR